MVSSKVKYAGIAVVGLVVLVGLGFVLGLFGVPSVDGVENQFAGVNETTTTTIEAETGIRNQQLDDWWVSHIERNEVTDLEIDFYIIVDPDPTGIANVEPIRLDTDEFDHETVIETDIFGTKPDTASDRGEEGDGTDGNDTDGAGEGDSTEEEDETNGEENGDDDGILGDDTLGFSLTS